MSGVARALAPIEATPEGGRPLRYFLTPEMLPDAETVAQLENLARTPGLRHHVAVLPDIHRKGRNVSPTGTAVVAKDAIAPRAIDTGVSCGMRMVSTEIEARDLNAALVDELFTELMRRMPLPDDHEVIGEQDAAEIFVNAGAWCRKAFGIGDDELDRIEDRASTPWETSDPELIVANVPKKAARKGCRRFCTVGAGNHFLELHEIVEIIDHEAAALFGLTRGCALFVMHSDSRGVAGTVMRLYNQELEARWGNGSPIWSLPAESGDGKRLRRALAAAFNFGAANRIAITETLRAAVRGVLRDGSLSLPLLYDCTHVSIKQEQWNGERLWVHRHGASRALPASQLQDHPIFSKTGQPVLIPGSMGHDSYVGMADEGTNDTYFSVNHGAGRLLDKPEALARFSERQVEEEMREKRIRLYRYGADPIAEQAPGSFKDISQVMGATSALGLARPVARLRPIAVLKG